MNTLQISFIAIIILVLGLLFMPALLRTWYFIYDKSVKLSEKYSKNRGKQNENQI